jgi:hypothetical protein
MLDVFGKAQPFTMKPALRGNRGFGGITDANRVPDGDSLL